MRIEVCKKHGLRYNAEVADGCARCRTESGARSLAGGGFAHPRSPSLGKGLLVAAALILGIGGSLFAAHVVAYRVGRAMLEEALEEPLDDSQETLESDFDELIGVD